VKLLDIVLVVDLICVYIAAKSICVCM